MTIAAPIKRKYEPPEGSTERQLIDRELTGLRYSYEHAGGIIAGPRQVLPFRCKLKTDPPTAD